MGTAIIASGKEKSMLSENQRKIFGDFHKSVEAEETLEYGVETARWIRSRKLHPGEG